MELDNRLPDPTTIHWHGLSLRNDMDGVHDLTQPAVASGAHHTYRFTVPDPGTFWFHPHMGLQLDRGLYAPLIVEDPDEPLAYDIEHVLVLDDWLDGVGGTTPDQVLAELQAGRMGDEDMGAMGHMGRGSMSRSAPLGGDAGDVTYPFHLVNGRPPEDRPTFDVPRAGARVRLRIINAGSDTAYRFAVGGHRLTVTHADGFAVLPIVVDQLLIGMGERYDVLIEVAAGSWPIVAIAEGKDDRAVAVLRTRDAIDSPSPPVDALPAGLSGRLLQYSDLQADPAVAMPGVFSDAASLRLTGGMMGGYRWTLDGKAYPDHRPIEVLEGERTVVSMTNETMMFHPMHLHGHTFRLGSRDDGPRKDTVSVLPGETLTMAIECNNPGQWLLHCHNTYHLETGMATVLSYVR